MEVAAHDEGQGTAAFGVTGASEDTCNVQVNVNRGKVTLPKLLSKDGATEWK